MEHEPIGVRGLRRHNRALVRGRGRIHVICFLALSRVLVDRPTHPIFVVHVIRTVRHRLRPRQGPATSPLHTKDRNGPDYEYSGKGHADRDADLHAVA